MSNAGAVLLQQYVSSFSAFDDMATFPGDLYPGRWELRTGDADEDDWQVWKPIELSTPRERLDGLYEKLPGRFPPLYEQLALDYRWAEAHLDSYTLLANPPGNDFSGLAEQIQKDAGLWEMLAPNGFLQFAKGPDLDYDPVCFDLRSRKQNAECRVVKIDHEEILCNHRIKEVAELAPTFRALVLRTIESAKTMSHAHKI